MPDPFVIPAFCKAGVVVNEGPNFYIEIQNVPVPSPGRDEILIKINCTGLCSSDVHIMQCDLGFPPISNFGVHSPGHEGVGVVVQVGANVKNFKLGDRAGIKPIMDTCGSCHLCCTDRETYCKAKVRSGVNKPGTYQQYIVSPARYASHIPDSVPDEIAAPIMCSASTAYRSLIESTCKAGDWAVFLGGGGGVGIQGVQLAKAMGMRPIVIDSGDAKAKLSKSMGAEAFVDFMKTSNTAQAVIDITDGIGAHGVFVTAPAAYPSAFSYIGSRIGANIMCLGIPSPGTGIMVANPMKFIYQNLSVKGTLVGSRGDTTAALDFARRGLLKDVCEVRPLSQMAESINQLRRGEVAGRIVIDFNLE